MADALRSVGMKRLLTDVWSHQPQINGNMRATDPKGDLQSYRVQTDNFQYISIKYHHRGRRFAQCQYGAASHSADQGCRRFQQRQRPARLRR